MKARGCLLALVCVFALIGPAGSAAAAAGKRPETRLSSFELRGSNGYRLTVVAIVPGGARRPAAEVSVQRGPLTAEYLSPAQGPAGLRARFGSLGSLRVHFARQARTVERPEPGCRIVTERGIFRGRFRFDGEDGYVTARATDPAGKVVRLPNGFCGFGNDRLPRPSIPGLPRQTVLSAQESGRRRTVSFEASRDDPPGVQASFTATLRERREGMAITRGAQTSGVRSSFANSGQREATISPARPFEGSAQFTANADGTASWAGSLAVSFAGAPQVPLAGEGFAARLCLHQPILTPCRP